MMINNFWIDALLYIALLVVLVVLYRSTSFSTQLKPSPEDSPFGDKSRTAAQRWRRARRRLIRQSGMDPDEARLGLAITRVLSTAFLALIGFWAMHVPGAIILGVLGWFLPDLWLFRIRSKRRRLIRSTLSYFLDLVTSLMHAGMTPERAFVRAGREGFAESNPLADEIALLGHELEMGKERSAAFLQLAERTGVTELRAIASSVAMGLRSGMPLMDTLRTQADLIRIRHGEEAIRKLNTASVLAMVPVFLCGIPVFMIIIYFPAALQIMETWRVVFRR